jgi:hypothetical protein
MQAVKWTYYGQDETYTEALQSYGTKFAADNWMHKKQGIQLGLTDSLRCKLPEGTDGTGYWTITVYALGYQDYTVKIQVSDENIVKSKDDNQQPSATQAPSATETPAAVTQTTATPEPSVIPSQTSTEVLEKTSVQVGSTYSIGKLKYKVTSLDRTVAVISTKNKKMTSVSIPSTVKIQNQTYKVTAIGSKALANCKKLKNVVVGKNVTELGKKVFAGDSKLKTITIQSKNLKKVGSGAFKGISKAAKIKVPSAKLKKYKKLLKGKGQGSKVKVVR